MQTQRNELQEQNRKLRQELDQLYNQGMNKQVTFNFNYYFYSTYFIYIIIYYFI